MRDLDQRHAGVIEAGGNIHHLLDGDLVPHRVHAVAQAHVMQFDLAATDFRFVGHQAASSIGMGVRVILPSRISWANISAVRAAAAVMMSRLPASFGRKSPSHSTSSKMLTLRSDERSGREDCVSTWRFGGLLPL